MQNQINLVKVFSVTKARDRDDIGARVTAWIPANLPGSAHHHQAVIGRQVPLPVVRPALRDGRVIAAATR